MSEQQNIDVVQQAYAAFGRSDLEGIIRLLDPHVSWVTPGPADFPTAGRRHGPAAVREFFGTLLNTVEISRFHPEQFLAQGETVVVLGTSREGVKTGGTPVDFLWVHVFTIHAGKIVAFEERADVSALVDQFRSAQARM